MNERVPRQLLYFNIRESVLKATKVGESSIACLQKFAVGRWTKEARHMKKIKEFVFNLR
jgi:hypothetical protein